MKKLGTDYLIQEEGTKKGKTLEITAYVSKSGITLFNNNHQLDFTFIDSKPEMLAKIGGMIRKIGLKAIKGKI